MTSPLAKKRGGEACRKQLSISQFFGVSGSRTVTEGKKTEVAADLKVFDEDRTEQRSDSGGAECADRVSLAGGSVRTSKRKRRLRHVGSGDEALENVEETSVGRDTGHEKRQCSDVVLESLAYGCSSSTPGRKRVKLDLLPITIDGVRRRGTADASRSPKCPEAAKRDVRGTPLEQEVARIKKENPGVVLFVQVGYKYEFFGEDAEIAGKVLSIMCYLPSGGSYKKASIPVPRLPIHVRRMVEAGYKVGIVTQTETAAIKKAGDTRSALFERRLTALYTQGTLVGGEMDPLDLPGSSEDIADLSSSSRQVDNVSLIGLTNYILSLQEQIVGSGESKDVRVGFVALDTHSGSLVYDLFLDEPLRIGLQTRLAHLRPSEIIYPETRYNSLGTEGGGPEIHSERRAGASRGITGATRRVLMEARSAIQKRSRVEVFGSGEAASVFQATCCVKECLSGQEAVMSEILASPLICLALLGLREYLRPFHLDGLVVDGGRGGVFHRFRREGVVLPGETLRNLEILTTENGTQHGSLFWLLNHANTAFGARQLLQWVVYPLFDVRAIDARATAVEELAHLQQSAMGDLCSKLKALPDLDRGLVRMRCRKCTPRDVFRIFSGFERVLSLSVLLKCCESSLLKFLLRPLPEVSRIVQRVKESVNFRALEANRVTEIFLREDESEGVQASKGRIAEVKLGLKEHLWKVRIALQLPSDFVYSRVSGVKYLLELPKSRKVPADWVRIQSTQKVTRYHSPRIVQLVESLAVEKETLQIEFQKYWKKFLERCDSFMRPLRDAISAVSTLDCVLALAHVARQPGYVRPVLSSDDSCRVEIEGGRHPMGEILLEKSAVKVGGIGYVPNDICLARVGGSMVITGPNMGGKSSYVRQVGILVIMAQMGGFVPAKYMRIAPFDGVFCRMGAKDNLVRGMSTFFVEMKECADILSRASESSLVILDELGRGTSTFDGLAIAYATLCHLVARVKCATLFVTHYLPICGLKDVFPGKVENYHMAFLEKLHSDGEESSGQSASVMFLYKLESGASTRSYGINVARLADLPAPILASALRFSRDLERRTQDRTKLKFDLFKEVVRGADAGSQLRERLTRLRGAADKK